MNVFQCIMRVIRVLGVNKALNRKVKTRPVPPAENKTWLSPLTHISVVKSPCKEKVFNVIPYFLLPTTLDTQRETSFWKLSNYEFTPDSWQAIPLTQLSLRSCVSQAGQPTLHHHHELWCTGWCIPFKPPSLRLFLTLLWWREQPTTRWAQTKLE